MRHSMTVWALCVGCTATAALADAIPAAVTSPLRPPTDVARDADRKPAETLAYAGIKAGDKVLELEPGRGYYTRLFSAVVGPKGKVYALSLHAPAGANAPAPAQGRGSPIDAVYRLAHAAQFANVTALYGVTMAPAGDIGLPEQVDVVWTSDNYHDFHNKSFGPLDMNAINASIFRNLKPGGLYVVIDHATVAGAGANQTETLHRIDPETVKQEVLAAGFVLDGQSDMLAHPDDDHSKPVFALQGREDDFVLRFRKPRNAAAITRTPDSELTAYFGNTLSIHLPTQQVLSLFYHPDHTYEEFGPNGASYGTWYLSVEGQSCTINQNAPAGEEGSVHCHAVEFPSSKHPHIGDVVGGEPGRTQFSLLKGYVYPPAQPAPVPAPGVARPAPQE